MITNQGRSIHLKLLAKNLSGIAIGNGGGDPLYQSPIAPSPDATSLGLQFFFDPNIQLADVVTPANGLRTRLFIRHTFENSLVPPNGTAITFANEVALFVKDPTTGLDTLFALKTFNLRQFRIPASGGPVVRDSFTIRWELF